MNKPRNPNSYKNKNNLKIQLAGIRTKINSVLVIKPAHHTWQLGLYMTLFNFRALYNFKATDKTFTNHMVV